MQGGGAGGSLHGGGGGLGGALAMLQGGGGGSMPGLGAHQAFMHMIGSPSSIMHSNANSDMLPSASPTTFTSPLAAAVNHHNHHSHHRNNNGNVMPAGWVGYSPMGMPDSESTTNSNNNNNTTTTNNNNNNNSNNNNNNNGNNNNNSTSHSRGSSRGGSLRGGVNFGMMGSGGGGALAGSLGGSGEAASMAGSVGGLGGLSAMFASGLDVNHQPGGGSAGGNGVVSPDASRGSSVRGGNAFGAAIASNFGGVSVSPVSSLTTDGGMWSAMPGALNPQPPQPSQQQQQQHQGGMSHLGMGMGMVGTGLVLGMRMANEEGTDIRGVGGVIDPLDRAETPGISAEDAAALLDGLENDDETYFVPMTMPSDNKVPPAAAAAAAVAATKAEAETPTAACVLPTADTTAPSTAASTIIASTAASIAYDSAVVPEAGEKSSLYIRNLPADADDLFLYRTFAPHGKGVPLTFR